MPTRNDSCQIASMPRHRNSTRRTSAIGITKTVLSNYVGSDELLALESLQDANETQVCAIHLRPRDRQSDDFSEHYGTAGTTVPNTLDAPRHGHELYNRFLDELLLVEDLGFDGVGVNEHHQSACGTMPSPNLMGTILARQTSRVKIAVVSGGRRVAGSVVSG